MHSADVAVQGGTIMVPRSRYHKRCEPIVLPGNIPSCSPGSPKDLAVPERREVLPGLEPAGDINAKDTGGGGQAMPHCPRPACVAVSSAEAHAEARAVDPPVTRPVRSDAAVAGQTAAQQPDQAVHLMPPPSTVVSATSLQSTLLTADGFAEVFSSAHDITADPISQEDANLSQFSTEFWNYASACKSGHSMAVSLATTVCVTAMHWIYQSIGYKGQSYKPMGLGGSSSSHPHAIKWLKQTDPIAFKAMESSSEYSMAMPILKKVLPPGRRAHAHFLKMSKVGEFQNTGGLRAFVKILRAAFIDILILHVLRTGNTTPPEGYGLRMHNTDAPDSAVPWNWSLLLRLVPSGCDMEQPSFEVSARLWATLLTGCDSSGIHWSWVSFLSAQVLPAAKDAVPRDHVQQLRRDLGDNVSVTVLATDRHKPVQSKTKTRVAPQAGKQTRHSAGWQHIQASCVSILFSADWCWICLPWLSTRGKCRVELASVAVCHSKRCT